MILVTGKKKKKILQNLIYTLKQIRLENVDKFKYLGVYVTESVDTNTDIKNRLAMAISSMRKLDLIWKNKRINIKSKIRLLKPSHYQLKPWTLNINMEARIEAF